MLFSIITSISVCLGIIATSIFKPSIKIKKLNINLYWVIALLGALFILFTNQLSFKELFAGLTADTGINPIQILILFLSMSLISIFLDEVGFFSYLASLVISKCKKNQFIIFISFYLLVSVLTMFTSNDIVILTLTPFIIFFCKNGKIKPLPYLVSEFIAANTWSMMFIIGNPTNIYLASSFNFDFIGYFKVMWLPTLGAGIIEFLILLLIFKKSLKEEISGVDVQVTRCDKTYTIAGLLILLICTIFLVISSYINLPMYLISAISLGVLVISILLISLIKKEKPVELGRSFLRAPYELIPFILSMFTLVLALTKYNVTGEIAKFLGSENTIYTYGYSSLLMANLLNNIPMSVTYSSILANGTATSMVGATFATVIGSNLGAFLTPVGALAGIMWMGILKKYSIKFRFIDFIKYGAPIGIVCATISFLLLNITF